MQPADDAVANVIPTDQTLDGGEDTIEPGSESQEGQQGTAQGVINWDSEENPYRQRYTGLQGTFQQVQQQVLERDMALASAVEEMAVLRAQSAGADASQVEAIRQQARAAIQQELGGRMQAAQLQTVTSALAPIAKQMVIADIAKKYNIDPAHLADTPNPLVAEALAKHIAKSGRTQSLRTREEQGIDRAESGGGGTISIRDMSPSQLISEGIRREAMRRR